MLEELLDKQKQLMERVPHTVRPDAAVKMRIGVHILDVLLRYLNSTGHKPWRPNPLSPPVQHGLLKELKDQVGVLEYAHRTNQGADIDFSRSDEDIRKMVSAYGVIEESIEYMISVFENHDENHKLEELVDILFFWLEQVAMSGFSIQQVVDEYHRKWSVNIKRYEDGAKGDYSWDRRGKENL